MPGSCRAECVDNARLVRLHGELGARLEELGRQTRAMVRGIKASVLPGPTDVEGIDHVPSAGC